MRSFAVVVLLSGAFAQEPLFRADEVVNFDEFKGDAEAKAMLLRNGFVVTGETCKQMFSPYTPTAEGSYFVTVDTVIHAYTVLLAQMVFEIEQRQVTVLRRFNQRLFDLVSKDKSKAGQAAAAFAGFGMYLHGSKVVPQYVVDWIQVLPVRYLPSDQPFHELLDPLGFGVAPRGIYTRNKRLRGYYAARHFFQRAALHEDTAIGAAAVALLRRLLAEDAQLKRDYALLQDPFVQLLGQMDSPDLRAQKRFHATIPGELDGERGNERRLLPALRTPSAELFGRVMHPDMNKRWLPNGLEFVAVGPLASAAGRRAFASSEHTDPRVLKVPPPPIPDSMHGRALQLLAGLQKPLPKTAPAAMRGAAWRDKQCATQLGGWAGLRSVWTLHARRAYTVLVRTDDDRPPGVVSPYPKFFAGLARLGSETLAVWKKLEEQLPIEPHRLAKEIGEYAWTLREKERGVVQRLRDGKALNETDRRIVREHLATRTPVLETLPKFVALCRDLSSISAKQLRGEALAKAELERFRTIGVQLARLEGYSSNSWLHPRDDHPRSAVVAGAVGVEPASYRTVGTARPELLQILIRRRGKVRVYRGAVFAFRTHRSPAPPTDAQWHELIDDMPAPRFTKSYRSATAKR